MVALLILQIWMSKMVCLMTVDVNRCVRQSL
jgi:hypothetical protein